MLAGRFRILDSQYFNAEQREIETFTPAYCGITPIWIFPCELKMCINPEYNVIPSNVYCCVSLDSEEYYQKMIYGKK